MEVRPGYKQTEVGMIPQDWDVSRVGAVAMVEGGFAFSSKRFLHSGKYQVVKMSNLYGGGLDLERSGSFLNELSEQEKHYLVRHDDILITLTGTTGKRDYGYTHKINDEQNLLVNQRVGRLHVGENAAADYVFFQIQTPCFLDQFFDVSKGGTGNQTNVGTRDIEEILIPVPPRPEQEAIAKALSDVDTLIESLEQLIAKKGHLKQGAMQGLLTGKKRLPGFNGAWEVKKLGELGDITGAGVDKKIRQDEISVRLVNYLDVYHRAFIYGKDLNHYVTARSEQIQRCAVKKGDIFFTPSSEMPYDIGISSVAMEDIPDAVYSYHVDRLRLYEDWDITFRAYIFKTRYFLKQAETFCEGSGKRYVINLTTFRELLSVYYPVDKKEQAAIATILSDMDAEVEQLKQKLNKYKMIKQGMMQELLTGKIRLI